MIAEQLAQAHARIAVLERELLETHRTLHRTENARVVLLGYYERHKAQIRELENALAHAAA